MQICTSTRAAAAALLNVTPRSISFARVALASGVPELIKAVGQGTAHRYEAAAGGRLRAVFRIGELSCDLETAERVRSDLHPTVGKQTKSATLRDAGISKDRRRPDARRCELARA